MNRKNRMVSFTIILILLLGYFSAVCPVNGQDGYVTAYEGPKAQFYGIKYQGSYSAPVTWDNHHYYSWSSLQSFDTTLAFDCDGWDSGKPNLYGEMTSIFIPSNTLPDFSWLGIYGTKPPVTNPINTYTWTTTDASGEDKQWVMQEWQLRWYVAISAEWEGPIIFDPVLMAYHGTGEAPPQGAYVSADNSYENLELWFKLDTKPTWYYEGSEQTFFAVASLQLEDTVNYKGTTVSDAGLDSALVDPRTEVSIVPTIQGSQLFLYDNAYGGAGYLEKQIYQYQGKELNPTYFKDYSYVKVLLSHFGVYGGYTSAFPIDTAWTKGDVAAFCFDVRVFSFGEWKVQDIEDDPDYYQRFVPYSTEGSDWLGPIFDWVSQNLWWLIPVAIFFIILLVAPWLLILIIELFR